MCVCARARACGHACGVWAEAERHSQAKDNAVCVCVCVVCRALRVCGGGEGVRVGGGVFMGCVGRGDACVHAVWGWGGVWVCVWCVPAGGAGRDRETQPGAKEDAVCVCVGMHVGGVVCGRAETEKRAWMDIPHHSLVFPERVHHLRDPDHSRP